MTASSCALRGCESTADGRGCELRDGHEGMHVADFGHPDGRVTWSDDASDTAIARAAPSSEASS